MFRMKAGQPLTPVGDTPDPRQALTLTFYLDPSSPTFANAMRSALKAGYSKTAAHVITAGQWWKRHTKKYKFLEQAEKNLGEFLKLNTKRVFVTEEGQVLPLNVDDPALLQTKYKATEFTLRTAGKEDYSERSEVINKNLNVNVEVKADEETKLMVKEFILWRKAQLQTAEK